MARKGARDDRDVRRSLRKGARQLAVMERALARIESKLVKAQVILTETAVRASDLEERVRALRLQLGLPDAAPVDGDGGGAATGAEPAAESRAPDSRDDEDA